MLSWGYTHHGNVIAYVNMKVTKVHWQEQFHSVAGARPYSWRGLGLAQKTRHHSVYNNASLHPLLLHPYLEILPITIQRDIFVIRANFCVSNSCNVVTITLD